MNAHEASILPKRQVLATRNVLCSSKTNVQQCRMQCNTQGVRDSCHETCPHLMCCAYIPVVDPSWSVCFTGECMCTDCIQKIVYKQQQIVLSKRLCHVSAQRAHPAGTPHHHTNPPLIVTKLGSCSISSTTRLTGTPCTIKHRSSWRASESIITPAAVTPV